MKTLKKILIALVVIVALTGISSVILLNVVKKRSLPNYNLNLNLKGLKEDVQVFRDERAVPHIFAKNNHDLYFVTGYVMAQDRLWQMDLLRRVTMGRLSEIFGPEMVDTDQLLRALRMSVKSELVLKNSSPELIESLQAFADGVNLFIEKQGKKLPPEFTILRYSPEKWQPIHTLNLIGYMSWDLASGWHNEVSLYKISKKIPADLFVELFPKLELQPTYVHPKLNDSLFTLLESSRKLDALPLEIFSGSNNWAVSGERSKSGKPLLANDMHLGFGLPGIWYQIHQYVEDELAVSGVALPGAPSVIVGHNEDIAWGMTNLAVDEMDFYVEKIDENDRYFFDDQWLPLEIVQEEILTSQGDTIRRENLFTHRGPIISKFKKLDDEAVSMRWTGNEFSNELRTIYLLNRASNWDEFRDALSSFGAVSQNIVYADRMGNIGMQSTGTVALRKSGDAVSVYPGETDQYDWEGFLDFDQLPFTYNPPEGVVSSANNRTTGPEYPHYLGTWFDFPARINRIREMLDATEHHDVQSFKQIQLDQSSWFAATYRDRIMESLSENNEDVPNFSFAKKALNDWNFEFDREQAAPLIFDRFYVTFLHQIMADELGETLFKEIGSGLMRHLFIYFFENPDSKWIDNQYTDEIETFDDIVFKSMKEVVDWITLNLGSDTDHWKWGKVHQLTLKHPLATVAVLDKLFSLNRGPFEVDGSFHTVNPMSYNFHRPFEVNHGASQRHIYDLSDWKASQVIIPTGTSGIPTSPFYASQHKKFLEGQYYNEFWLNKTELEIQAKYKAIYSPLNSD